MHELNMRDPKKVLDRLEEGKDIIKKMKGIIGTVTDISKMDLAIGGVDKGFAALDQLYPHLDNACGVFDKVAEKIDEQVRTFLWR